MEVYPPHSYQNLDNKDIRTIVDVIPWSYIVSLGKIYIGLRTLVELASGK